MLRASVTGLRLLLCCTKTQVSGPTLGHRCPPRRGTAHFTTIPSPPIAPPAQTLDAPNGDPLEENFILEVDLSAQKINLQAQPYPTGKKTALPIPPLPVNQRKRKKSTQLNSRRDPRSEEALLYVIARTNSPTQAWTAYSTLIELNNNNTRTHLHRNQPLIPLSHLRRLVRLLSRQKPKTRTLFLRVHQLLTHITSQGGIVRLYEWNALADNAGKGWHKTSPQDYKLAFGIFEDMIKGLSPGETNAHSVALVGSDKPPTQLVRVEQDVENNDDDDDDDGENFQPDIVTFTTLLNLAVSTLDDNLVKHAQKLLDACGLKPDRMIHLIMIKYYTKKKDAFGIRRTLDTMHLNGYELGLDGLNACIWSYSIMRRLDIIDLIYQVLRWRVGWEEHLNSLSLSKEEISSCLAMSSEEASSHSTLSDRDREYASYIHKVRTQLVQEEQVSIHFAMKPDTITYTMIIQAYAYHGDFDAMLGVFMDLLQTENTDLGAPMVPAVVPSSRRPETLPSSSLGGKGSSSSVTPEPVIPPSSSEMGTCSSQFETGLASSSSDTDPSQLPPNHQPSVPPSAAKYASSFLKTIPSPPVSPPLENKPPPTNIQSKPPRSFQNKTTPPPSSSPNGKTKFKPKWETDLYRPSIPIFRAIFLGFTKHAVAPPLPSSPSPIARKLHASRPWNLHQLQELFDLFLLSQQHPPSEVLQKRMVYWILTAFQIASGGDEVLMLDVWERLEMKFSGGGGQMPRVGKNHRLWKMRNDLVDAQARELDRKRVEEEEGEGEDGNDSVRDGARSRRGGSWAVRLEVQDCGEDASVPVDDEDQMRYNEEE